MSSLPFFNSGGVIKRKLPNLSSTTCPGLTSGLIMGLTGGRSFGFFGDSGLFGGGSFIAIALRTLMFFSGDGTGGCPPFLGDSSKLPFLPLIIARLSIICCSSFHSSRSGFFLKREPLLGGGGCPVICIFHLDELPAEAAASATAWRAFCSRVGDGESRRPRLGLSLSSLLE